MKKWLKAALLAASVLALGACSNDDDDNKIVIGAAAGLHDKILEKAAPILEKDGIELEIRPYTEYVMPNQDLDSGELDANYFQHVPYLNQQIKDHGYDFVSVGGVHVEPMGIYSAKYDKVEDIPDGGTIIFSNSVSEQGRILTLLETAGLIKLKDGIDKTTATLDDIAENPKNLKFDNSSNPEVLLTYLKNNEGDAIVINSNFTIDGGLNPSEDSIAMEGSESNYVNVIVVRKEDENNKAIKRLVEVLQSKEIQQYILDEWKGNVVPTPTSK